MVFRSAANALSLRLKRRPEAARQSLACFVGALLLALIGGLGWAWDGPSQAAASALVLSPVALVFALALFWYALTPRRTRMSYGP